MRVFVIHRLNIRA